MNRNVLLALSVLFFAGIIVPAYAQITDHIVINEVDINPLGDDSASISEWVELYNPTDSEINLSGWSVASTTILEKTMIVPPGTVIKPGQFLTYSYQKLWFTDLNESVELRNENGVVIDKTPVISDLKNDFTSWQRIYDGFDSGSSNDWKFATATIGKSNGKLIVTQESDDVSVTVSSDKPSYLFGDVAVISGTVSEEVYVVKPFFQPEQIVITITGTNFNKIITMYPDLNLNYETTLSLHQVLGINAGNYDVSVSYAGATDITSFSVGYEIIEKEIKEEGTLGIITDKSQYLPGQWVTIIASNDEIIPFQGMKFIVTDNGDNVIDEGHIFPNSSDTFETKIYITTVNPRYGTYNIHAEYFDRSATTSFEVVEDFKEDVPISLWTDKKAYGLGDVVNISGRLNDVFVGTMNLEVVQTKQIALKSTSSGSDSGFKILDGVIVQGDGSFTYSFKIPNDSLRLGDYRISVSQDVGTAKIIIPVVDDPENFVASDEPLTVQMDMASYEFGDTMTISGFVKDPYSNSSYSTGAGVKITISHEDGSPLEIQSLSKNNNVVVGYDFSAIPETSGRYSVQVDVTKNIFTTGNYVVESEYQSFTATNIFSIADSLDLKGGPIITLDKEVYGLGETVYLNGAIPPTGDNSIDISITKPDGSVRNSGATIDNQRFSWSWITPISERYQNLKIDEGRDVIKSNFGVYKIKASIASESVELFFKVSADPENDSLSTTPLFVSTEKSLYKAGEKLKVIGNVISRQQGDEGLVVPERVTIQVLDGTFPFKQIHESSVYPTQGGTFSSLFELPATIFGEGLYTVKASYSGISDNAQFSVANDFVFGIDDDLSLLVDIDKQEYYPGDVVVISGKPNKLIYLEAFEVSVIQKSETEITCGSFICGTNTGPTTSILPSPSGSFTHQFAIPDDSSSIGIYEVTVDADFETKSIQFEVIEKPLTIKSDTVIEKENRISAKIISIATEEKITDDVTIAPRVISGSLITPSRGDESNVNLKVSTPSGVCIIGPDANCLVKESTRKQGQIYDVVDVDGISLNVRYSGPDVRLEKFSILPASVEFLPDTNWNVDVIKEEQVSRFYYKVTYKTLE
ncbi:MAG: lamin tail domain-containing protein [Nitrosopumilus sp.]|nr:lamin tail domain-containing protein [Nitrosopumilus sp.]MBL7017995.1 lamin tail domain-containing protein [Nitrosopumilus sp.]